MRDASSHNGLGRRSMMRAGGAATASMALSGCAGGPSSHAASLPPVRASADRIIKITVCTRPFRAEGPRLDVETIGDKIVVHNYGHGGSGWSLSWGSGRVAARNALAAGSRDIAVIGCGALGLTTATLLQRAGIAVTIYAKDRPPDVRSSLATGVWSPDSRICLASAATPAFRQVWEEMCRTSFQAYTDYLGLPADPVEWIDAYHVSAAEPRVAEPQATGPHFAELEEELVPDLIPAAATLGPGQNPFPGHHASRRATLMFNLTDYQRVLMEDFLRAGGRIETREFHSPAEFAALPHRTLINCTGYGARSLMGDTSIVPVRGQLAHLIPQPEIRYGVTYDRVSLVPRRDGLVVQAYGPDEGTGYDNESTEPDRAEAVAAVTTIGSLFAPAA